MPTQGHEQIEASRSFRGEALVAWVAVARLALGDPCVLGLVMAGPDGMSEPIAGTLAKLTTMWQGVAVVSRARLRALTIRALAQATPLVARPARSIVSPAKDASDRADFNRPRQADQRGQQGNPRLARAGPGAGASACPSRSSSNSRNCPHAARMSAAKSSPAFWWSGWSPSFSAMGGSPAARSPSPASSPPSRRPSTASLPMSA